MKLISKKDFNNKVKERPKYFNGRWSYYKEVLNFLKDKDFKNILEIGCGDFPIVKDSDTIDLNGNTTYNFDLNDIPWKLDKHYDLIIALQVLEHLKDPKSIFKEIKKFADYAIISLPYKWTWEQKSHLHYNIDEDKIKEWTGIEPIKKVVNKRIILFYEL